MNGLSPLFHFAHHPIWLSIFFILFSTELTNSELRCHERFIYFQSNCYYFSSQRLPFTVANIMCNNYSNMLNPCHLTSIHSEGENHFVFQRARQLWGTATYWLGAIKTSKLGNLSWLDGSQMNFSQLQAYENHGACLQQWTKESEWKDTYCSRIKYFVCKQKSLPGETEPCEHNPCENGGTCSVHLGTVVCECASGYYGEICYKSGLT
ncbi:C-type lectin domain family 17, member A [Holothuria leucospilota]|uniref:C-type lectin domain family 17, member A n=1 Tax=Holothuria leucospilota TaxID=206669 RepID=A0A9Q1C2D6_HOLLE|nr:C-type lectin domain family 17, member A [Holothuria leucospilota]